MVVSVNTEKNTVHVDGKQVYPVASASKVTMAELFYQHIGTKEYAGIVETIQKWYYGRLVQDAWCATSLSYFADKANVADQVGKHENCDRMKDYMSKRGTVHKTKRYGGDGKYLPKKGDVVFMSSKNTFADITHVGVVYKVEGDKLTVISGNMDDMIKLNTYILSTSTYVVAYGEVKY